MSIFINNNYGTVTEQIDTLIISDKTIVANTPARTRSESVKRSTPSPTENRVTKTPNNKPYTIPYICTGEQQRTLRLHRVMLLMQDWQWISTVSDMENQFEPLFSGYPKDCHIDWKPNQAILFEFLSQLFKQPYVEHHTGESVSAIMRNQFHIPNPKSNILRVSKDEHLHIQQILTLLNPDKPLPRMA